MKIWEVVTHPLYGKCKTKMKQFYRSVVIKKSTELDVASINLISEAIGTFEKFRKNKEVPQWTDSVKDDFSVIDHDLLLNAINRIL